MSYNQQSIKNWAEDDRPREKLLQKGYRSLSDSELLAILIRSGDRNNSAVALAKEILNAAGNNWNELSRFGISDLCKFKGIGKVKAITIITALEIGRRRILQEAEKKPHIKGSRDAFDLMQPILGDLKIEEFWVLFLNQRNVVIKKEKISSGGINGTLVDVRVILRTALEIMATGMVLVHNHPSGNLFASRQDKLLTEKIKKAANLVDIEIMDHIIVTQKSYFSFADSGEL